MTIDGKRGEHAFMETYRGVRGKARVAAISKALETGGAAILREADPSIAPFEYRIRTRSGEVLDLICYAFTANRYKQSDRPAGEHRFQVKYGSAFHRAHEIFVDASRRKLTLMFGVHEELDLFVAVDPAMHAVTWFSRSIEFKEHQLRRALRTGWFGWERERVADGRRQVDPREDLRVEALLAFRADHFMRYLELERAATGMDPAERLHLIERLGEGATGKAPASSGLIASVLEAQFDLSASEILEVIAGRGRLLTAVLGGVAEHHLERYFRRDPDITDVTRLDADGQPDFTLRYRNRSKAIRVECKNIRRTLRGHPWVDFQKTRAAKGDPCSRYYAASQFDVLAACMHPRTERWDFQFCETAALEPHETCATKLAVKVPVQAPKWQSTIVEILDRLSR